MNENLRHALIRARLQPVDIAARLAVDPKTVARWISGRIPHPRHRFAVADLLETHENDLWPDVSYGRRHITGEIKAVYPHRWSVPAEVWRSFFQAAEKEIGILVYSGLFLAEDAGLLRILTERARTGARVRILLGDPDSPQVAARGAEEGTGSDVMAARIHNAFALYRPLQDIEGIEIRRHRTVLYNSIYRADDSLLVNLHVYGTRASEAPVIYLTRTEADNAALTYLDSFERVWTSTETAGQTV
ncbi:XRE family transcriptional regulator [Streptosporangium sp. NPDC023825]|uniref:XRE family transcriptional regulator n=1 Tax=Streptosporangium sp. NPDC023825 TaxID=3154909 RepID=UPI0034373CA8